MDVLSTQIVMEQLAMRRTFIADQLGEFTRSSLRVSRVANDIDRALHEMTAQLLAGVILSGSQEFIFEVPASWWEHWKQDHADTWYGHWIARRWPPRIITHRNVLDFTQYATYPGANLPAVPPGEYGRPVILEEMRLRDQLAPGIRHIRRDNPRAVFLSRRKAERTVIEIAFRRLQEQDLMSRPPLNLAHVIAFFDALSHLGVNVDQLITETAAEDRGMPVEA